MAKMRNSLPDLVLTMIVLQMTSATEAPTSTCPSPTAPTAPSAAVNGTANKGPNAATKKAVPFLSTENSKPRNPPPLPQLGNPPPPPPPPAAHLPPPRTAAATLHPHPHPHQTTRALSSAASWAVSPAW